MDSEPILEEPWPDDLDPASVPFKTRTETVLCRAGFHDDPTQFDTLIEADVMEWWNAGVATVSDIRIAGNRAIRRHHDEVDARSQLNTDLDAVTGEPWTRQVWWRDPRFKTYLPRGEATVYEIATAGPPDDRHRLWRHLDGLKGAVRRQAALSLPDAVAEYVAGISGQHGVRLEALLACTGLNGHDPITGSAAGRMLGVTPARMYQIRDRLEYHRLRTQPPAGVWMPQVATAERFSWPDGYTEAGIAAAQAFFAVS